MMNEKKDKWMCPVCNNPTPFESLMLDGFFSELVTSRRLPDDEHEIVLHNDASWDPLPPKIPDHLRPRSPQPQQKKVETLSLDDDTSDSDQSRPAGINSKCDASNNKQAGTSSAYRGNPPSNRSVECVTLDSDSDECNDVIPPASKQPRLGRPNAFIDDDSTDSCNAVTPTSSSTNTIHSTTPTPSGSSNQQSEQIPPLHEAHQALVALADAAAASLQKVRFP